MKENQINIHCKCAFCIKPSWINKEDYIRETATFLGYPKCCTEAYIENVRINKHVFGVLRHQAMTIINKTADRPNYGVGFVPCKYHADRIVNQGKSVKRIIRKRICSTSFPYANASEFKKYLRKIKKKYENN